ncbi:MAG: SDR family oxidoreductase [Deltaproteobacteria bacterium]|nr:SDR family oxidoreductase [Deltaproteobacteria bacterium]
MKYPMLDKKKYSFTLTGGAGFIGSNLALKLLELGQKVKVLDNFMTGSKRNIEEIKDFAKKIDGSFSFIEGDIREPEACAEAVRGADFVIHNAALGSVPRSVEDPLTSSEINIGGTLNMMVATKDAGIKRFVYASSSSVYGDAEKLPKVEGDEGMPLSPYAVTKCSNELYGAAFKNSYGLSTVGLRYFNVFGPRQDALSPYAAVIPIFVSKLLKNEAPMINGDGETSRDFTYIDNVVEANIKAVFAPELVSGKAFNIAYGGRVTLNKLYEAIRELLGKSDIDPIYGEERVGDIRHSFADISNAKKALSYDPEIDFSSGLKLSIDWYKENL